MTKKSEGGNFRDLLMRPLNRRKVLVTGGLLAAAGTAGCGPVLSSKTPFQPIDASPADRVIVPDGYTAEVLIRWGDPLVAGSNGMDIDGILGGSLFEPGAGAQQAGAFGTACDGMGVIPISENRLALCINHESPEMSRMFPGWSQALRERSAGEFIEENPEMVAVMRAGVGVSVLEVERIDGRWNLVSDSPLNVRITADTPMEFGGPAARHPWVGGSADQVGRCLGTFNNCAAGSTPWGTYLTAEENVNFFFGNGAQAEFDPLLERATRRFGLNMGPSSYRWELVDERFDSATYPAEAMKYGWIVEIDPLNPDRTIKKRTALGRFRHEGATTVLDASGHPVVYMGDDSYFEYFYKFIGDRAYDSDNPESSRDLLDDGTLYVAKLNDDGSGEWLPLVYGPGTELGEANEFTSQADVVFRCREAADLLGATPLDRPEDVAVNPINHRVYLACTDGNGRGNGDEPDPDDEDAIRIPGPDAANPRGPNPFGHILEFTEDSDDSAALRFRWEIFVLAGDPGGQGLAAEAVPGRLAPTVAYYAGQTDSAAMSAFANPDNLAFDDKGNLWIVTDGAQPGGGNNGCFVCPTEGADRGIVRQFMSGPVGAEISGCTFSPDGQTLFLTVQHPGSGGSLENPRSHWPDGGDAQPRSSLIAVRATDIMQRFDT